MKAKPIIATILGKKWSLIFRTIKEDPDLKRAWGYTDSPEQKRRRIVLRKGLLQKPRLLLEIIIHEATHAASWHIDEEYIENYSRDVSRLLWRLGWRKAKEIVDVEKQQG